MKYHVQSVRNQANHALETLEMIEKVEWPQNVEKMAWPRTTLRCSFWSFEFSAPKKGCCQFTSATVLVPSHHTKIIRAKIQRIGTQESIRFCPGIIDRLHLCRWWWQFMLMTILICWWLFSALKVIIKMIQSSKSQNCHHYEVINIPIDWIDKGSLRSTVCWLHLCFGHLWFSSPLVVFVPSIF